MDVKTQEVMEMFEGFSMEETQEILDAIQKHKDGGDKFIDNSLELIDRRYIVDMCNCAVDAFKLGMEDVKKHSLQKYVGSFAVGVVITSAGMFGYKKLTEWKKNKTEQEI